MEDSDEEEEAAVLAPPPTITQQLPVDAKLPAARHATPSTTVPAAAPVAAATKSTPAPTAAAPKGWGKPLAFVASTTASISTPPPSSKVAVTRSQSTSSPSTAAQASPTSTATFSSPVISAAAPVKSASTASVQSSHVPAKKALPTFKTWGELTASLAPKSPTVAPVKAAAALPAGLAEDEEEAAPMLTTTVTPAIATASSTFDPELDSSRDGLPLLFKGLSKAPAASDLCVVMEEESSKSRQGIKRKEMEPATEEEQATPSAVDMTALVAGFKQQTPTSAAAAPVKAAWGGAGLVTVKKVPIAEEAATPAEVQQPATGKKMKQADGSAKNVETVAVAASAKPNSFLSAVTGKVAMTDDSAPASSNSSVAESSVSASAPASAAAAAVPVVDMAQRLKQRQKQVDIGKGTPEYLNYIRLVPV